jgi:hypothetical protein
MSECIHGYLDRQCPYCEIDRLTAELAEARELLQRVWNDEREWIGGRLCFAIEAAIGAGKGE